MRACVHKHTHSHGEKIRVAFVQHTEPEAISTSSGDQGAPAPGNRTTAAVKEERSVLSVSMKDEFRDLILLVTNVPQSSEGDPRSSTQGRRCDTSWVALRCHFLREASLVSAERTEDTTPQRPLTCPHRVLALLGGSLTGSLAPLTSSSLTPEATCPWSAAPVCLQMTSVRYQHRLPHPHPANPLSQLPLPGRPLPSKPQVLPWRPLRAGCRVLPSALAPLPW